jgi:hypothetical protein
MLTSNHSVCADQDRILDFSGSGMTGHFYLTFMMIVGISCTFFASQLFMLPVMIFKKTTPRLTVKIQLGIETDSFYKLAPDPDASLQGYT